MSANISPEQLRELADQLERQKLQARPLAKTISSFRESTISKSHAAFAGAIDKLLRKSISKRQIAIKMDMDIHTFCDVLEGKRKLQGWMIAALPADALCEFLRIAGTWEEERLDGTDG